MKTDIRDKEKNIIERKNKNKFKDNKLSKTLLPMLVPIGMIFFSFFVGAIIMLIFGYNPIQAYVSLMRGAFVGNFNITQTLLNSVPLIFTGLAVAFAFRCGLFNIGAEGQLYLGSLASTYIATAIILPAILHVPLILIAGALAGGLWAFLPGILKAKTGSHEVITTMMMSWIGVFFSSYVIRNILKDPRTDLPVSKTIYKSAELIKIDKILPIPALKGTRLHIGFFIAILTALLIWYILKKTTIGYEVRAVGFNPYASEYAGISIGKNIILALFISGMLAGLAGSVEIAGLHHKLWDRYSAMYGFTGIAIALLAKNNPIGVIFAAILFGATQAGGKSMQLDANVPVDMTDILEGIVIFAVAADEIIKMFIRAREKRRLARIGTT